MPQVEQSVYGGPTGTRMQCIMHYALCAMNLRVWGLEGPKPYHSL